MRKLLPSAIVALVLLTGGIAFAFTFTSEVLVLNSAPTKIPRTPGLWGFELVNRGPNSEDCAIGQNTADGGSPVYVDGGLVLRTGKANPVDSNGGRWSGSENPTTQIWCLAATADQVTGAATILNESP